MPSSQTTTAPARTPTGSGDTREGFIYALSAYLLWGFLPLYMKAVAYIPFAEIVAHRIVWSVPVAGVVLLFLRRTADIREAFRSPRTLVMAALTASVISINWGVYVWAIAVDRAVETALGYYINPLVSILMGATLLGERLDRYQIMAVGLACLAVLVLTVGSGGLPWISLILALSFASYGFLRKTLPIGPAQGFFLEVLLLSLPATIYILWLGLAGKGLFVTGGWYDTVMLLLAGPVTAVPLILYASGAKLLRLSTIGIMQYIAPTLIFLIAVFVFGEPFGVDRAIAFTLIWTALAIYSWSMLAGRRKRG
ncbi:MAG: EamA family transporter RarD [Salaquimonas sp.]|nr:EamA family transporter RarD [Salaquimonas sp.]